MATDRNAMSFKDASKLGDLAEDIVEQLLKNANAVYTRHELKDFEPRPTDKRFETPAEWWAAYKEWRTVRDAQDKGDFLLKNGVYLEVKNDAFFERTGNLFIEVGEYLTEENAMRMVGVSKHQASPTVFCYRLGEENSKFKWIVFTAQELWDAFNAEYPSPFFKLNKSNWNGKEDIVKVGLLLTKALEAIENSTDLGFMEICENEQELKDAIKYKSIKARKLGSKEVFKQDAEEFFKDWGAELTTAETVYRWAGVSKTPLKDRPKQKPLSFEDFDW